MPSYVVFNLDRVSSDFASTVLSCARSEAQIPVDTSVTMDKTHEKHKAAVPGLLKVGVILAMTNTRMERVGKKPVERVCSPEQ